MYTQMHRIQDNAISLTFSTEVDKVVPVQAEESYLDVELWL